MRAVNAKQKQQAFFKFLIFFILTLALVVTAIYFDFKVPARQNRYLQGELDQQRAIERNQETFVSTMEDAIAMIKSLDSAGTNVTQVSGMITERLVELNGLVQKDKSNAGRMNQAIAASLWDLFRAKTDMKSLREGQTSLNELKSDLRDCKAQLDQAQATIAGYRASGFK